MIPRLVRRSTLPLAAVFALLLAPAVFSTEDAPPAPDFELTDHNGQTVRLSDYQGRIVVLEWFNEECPFVQRHHKDGRNTMVSLADRYAQHDVVWLAINSTNHATVDSNKKIAAKWEIPYPILDDSAGDIGRAYGARTTPHMFVIDPAGRIVYAGAIDDKRSANPADARTAKNHVRAALTETLAGKPVTTASTTPYGCSVKY